MKRNIMGHITPTEIILLTESNGKLTVETANNYKAISCSTMKDAIENYREMVYKITSQEREVL
jgi:hypothetical protein